MRPAASVPASTRRCERTSLSAGSEKREAQDEALEDIRTSPAAIPISGQRWLRSALLQRLDEDPAQEADRVERQQANGHQVLALLTMRRQDYTMATSDLR